MPTNRTIDDVDRQILEFLQNNARTPNAEIARQVGMVPSAIAERIRKLEEDGIILGYSAQLNPQALERGLLAFVLVRTDESVGERSAGDALMEIPEIQEVHHVAGEDCFLVKIRTKDPPAFGELLRGRFGQIASIRSTRSTIVLGTLKESAHIFLGGEGD